MNLPNKITVSRICLIPVFVLILSVPFPFGDITLANVTMPMTHFIGGLIFIVAAGTDWLDGYYARKYQLVTTFGKFLDPLADKLLVAASLIMLVQFDMAPAWAVIIIISREFAVTGLRLVASGEGIVLAASQMGKLKTATQLIAIALLLLHNFPLAFLSFPVDLWMLYIATFFTALSGVDYFMKNWHVMKGSM
ncbi:MAG TPA: CDP-diacylglycerol--glycerol-3-phosphate 3-phosphatidyltransferase [Bacillota bacterium]|nr:CDP-diacylglycerol--glycerol-3-phosphate 3-phosphatidyltransferase [Bacillota bacterium]